MGLAATAAIGQRFSLLERVAQAASFGSASPYRALVGVFLVGGNDGNDMVAPWDTTTQAAYTQWRSSLGTTFTPVTSSSGKPYAFHNAMPNLAARFTGGNLAVVFNVGPLVTPVTDVNDYNAIVAGTATNGHKLPDHLFSHIDQQNAWSSGVADPAAYWSASSPAVARNTGWGGRLADVMEAAAVAGSLPNATFPPLTSYGGPVLFGVGANQQPLSVLSDGSLGLSGSGSTPADTARLTALTQMMSAQMKSGIAPVDAFTGSFTSALSFSGVRATARSKNPLPTKAAYSTLPGDIALLFPTSAFGQQLLHIAQDILAGAAGATTSGLGLRRQIFAATKGGFDTHTTEASQHKTLYADMDAAIEAFNTAIAQLNGLIQSGALPGVPQLQVTLFTMSDFARTFIPNSAGGTDHGWGNHMLVLGCPYYDTTGTLTNPVKGNLAYGTPPDYVINSGTTTTGKFDVGEGRWIPSVSSEVYANTLATWLGAASTDQAALFAHLANFSTKNLGFMNP